MDMILSWKTYLILPISILLITRCVSLSLSLKAPICVYVFSKETILRTGYVVNRLQEEEIEPNHCPSRWSQVVLGVSKVPMTTVQR